LVCGENGTIRAVGALRVQPGGDTNRRFTFDADYDHYAGKLYGHALRVVGYCDFASLDCRWLELHSGRSKAYLLCGRV